MSSRVKAFEPGQDVEVRRHPKAVWEPARYEDFERGRHVVTLRSGPPTRLIQLGHFYPRTMLSYRLDVPSARVRDAKLVKNQIEVL